MSSEKKRPWTREAQLEVRDLLEQAVALLDRIEGTDEVADELRFGIAALDEEME